MMTATPLQQVTCVEAQAATVKLNKKTASIQIGKSVQLKLSGAKKVTWKSSNAKVAKVTSTGKVTGVKAGTCYITVTNKATKKSYKCKVTVKPAAKPAVKHSVKVTSDLIVSEVRTDANDEKVNCYEVDLKEFSAAWVESHFHVTTTPANESYSISYADAKTGKEYSSIPQQEGLYAITFSCGKASQTVWADAIVLKAFDYEKEAFKLLLGGAVIMYNGGLLDTDIKVYVDGTEAVGTKVIAINNQWQQATSIMLPEVLSNGNHVISLRKNGYKDFSFEVYYEKPVYEGIFTDDPMPVSKGIYCFLVPEAEGKKLTFFVDGVEVPISDKRTDQFGINGDGWYVGKIDVSKIAPGKHTLFVSVEDVGEATCEVDILQ